MMHPNTRLPRPTTSTQLAHELHDLQLVVQEISDLLSDREQVIDTLSQEIHHLHDRIDQVEQENVYLHQQLQQTTLSSRSIPSQTLTTPSKSSIQESHLETSSSQIQEKIFSENFIQRLTEGIEKAISKSIQTE